MCGLLAFRQKAPEPNNNAFRRGQQIGSETLRLLRYVYHLPFVIICPAAELAAIPSKRVGIIGGRLVPTPTGYEHKKLTLRQRSK